MNKEEIKKEFIAWLNNPREWLPNEEQIADFWLSKLDAYESSFLERIEGMKETTFPSDLGQVSINKRTRNQAIDDIINLIKEGKE